MTKRTKRRCTIDGCEKPHVARGWCNKHLHRWKKYGDPNYLLPLAKDQPCNVKDCERPQAARGYCRRHWGRWKIHGDPLAGETHYKTPEESFAARTEWQGECLIWTGTTIHNGYGRITVDGRGSLAHRYAWERVHGPVPEGMDLDHTCYNRLCCNVNHLRPATRSQNVANRPGPTRASKSGVRNVYKRRNRWGVAVRKQGITHNFGTYDDINEAAEVAEQARRELFGEFAGRG